MSDIPAMRGSVIDAATAARQAQSNLGIDPAVVLPAGTREAAQAEAERSLTVAKDALAEKLRERNEKYLLRIGRNTLRAFFALIVLTFVLAFVSLEDRAGGAWQPDPSALFLSASAALIVWFFLGILSVMKRKSGRLTGMLIGQDGRLSTSYFQAWVWTIVIVWAFIFFVLQTMTGGPKLDLGGESLLGLNSDYLLLLGGPFAALIIAMQTTQSKVAAGELQSVQASETRLTDVISSDSGRTDLVDAQYILFNGVALIFFFGSIIRDHTALPDIPDQLVVLTSGAALTYVAKKAIRQNAPIITSIVPVGSKSVATSGGQISIRGRNFIPAGGETTEAVVRLRVKFGSTVVAPILPSSDQVPNAFARLRNELTVEVPDLSGDEKTDRMIDIVVVTASDTETPAFPLRVHSAR